MMTAAATITARIEKLKAARDTGVLTVKHGETLTTFRSLAEIEATIAKLESDLAAANGTSKRRVRYMYQSGKGL
jgi:peptidoglycan hydrolase CwlO-like protein